MGRRSNPPPQFGHTLPSFVSAQSAQNVHSYEQIRASAASGGKSLSQYSQFGRSCNAIVPSLRFDDQTPRFSNVPPVATSRQFSAARAKLRSNVPVEIQATCGVITTLSNDNKISPEATGSSTNTSSPAPPSRPDRSASVRAV